MKRTAFTDTLSRCACAFMSVWICTQNVRMIYFHIWFVCASSSNVIHIKWNFLCSFNIQHASLILIAVVIRAIWSATMKSFTVFQVYLFSFEIFFPLSPPCSLSFFSRSFFSRFNFRYSCICSIYFIQHWNCKTNDKYSVKQNTVIFPFIRDYTATKARWCFCDKKFLIFMFLWAIRRECM